MRKNYAFDELKHIDSDGHEYWKARELMEAIGYSKWIVFRRLIKRAMLLCENNHRKVEKNFIPVKSPVQLGQTMGNMIDYKLSKYACSLIYKNIDDRKIQTF